MKKAIIKYLGLHILLEEAYKKNDKDEFDILEVDLLTYGFSDNCLEKLRSYSNILEQLSRYKEISSKYSLHNPTEYEKFKE